MLAEGLPTTCVYLKGAAQLIRLRLQQGTSHFMKADMLAGQVDLLEEPSDAIVVDIPQPPGAIVQHIVGELHRLPAGAGHPQTRQAG